MYHDLFYLICNAFICPCFFQTTIRQSLINLISWSILCFEEHISYFQFAERIQSRELQTDLDQSSPLVGFPSKAVIGSSILVSVTEN